MKTLTLTLLTTATTLAQIDVNAAPTWSMDEAEISRELSNYAYCGHKAYMTLQFEGKSTGFQPTLVLYDHALDVEGYIGYLPSNNSIYVVFMGTTSPQQFITDLDGIKSKY